MRATPSRPGAGAVDDPSFAAKLDLRRKAVNTLRMKTTFDLPDALVRRAKSVAAEQGRPLRELVAEAIDEKLVRGSMGGRAIPGYREGRRLTWVEWSAGLQKLPDGSLFNPAGADDSFFEALEEIRRRPWTPRNPFDDSEEAS